MKFSHELFKSPINPTTNINPVYHQFSRENVLYYISDFHTTKVMQWCKICHDHFLPSKFIVTHSCIDDSLPILYIAAVFL
jgi:hypothetical protein